MNSELDTRAESRAVTMDDIARAVGVTKVTVSHALSGKGRVADNTRALVLQMARDMGYRPNPHALNLTRGRCHDTIGLFAHSLDLGVMTRKLQLMQRLLSGNGYRAPMYICGGQFDAEESDIQAEAVSNVRLQRPLGIICNTMGLSESALQELRIYRQEGGVLVSYDNDVELECDRVIFDREHNSYISTHHLLELGHRRIAFYSGWILDPSRLAGYLKALAEFGIKPNPDYIFQGHTSGNRHEFDGGYTDQNGVVLANNFLALKPRPTAACICHDAVASTFLAEMIRRGINVPGEISVVGHDNLPVGEYISVVPLTTASQPMEEIAETAVELLRDRVEKHYAGPPRTVRVNGKLVERRSTASCPVSN